MKPFAVLSLALLALLLLAAVPRPTNTEPIVIQPITLTYWGGHRTQTAIRYHPITGQTWVLSCATDTNIGILHVWFPVREITGTNVTGKQP